MKNNCCICGKEIIGFGNSPWPIKNSGYCCDKCNSTIVIQARLKILAEGENKNEKRKSTDKC